MGEMSESVTEQGESTSDPSLGEVTLELRLAAEPENVVVGRQAVLGIADWLDLGPQRSGDIAIAVSEACTNVVMHAYPGGSGDVTIRAWLLPDDGSPTSLVVEIVDHGAGIIPGPSSDDVGLGLGLPLMMAIGDEMSVRSERGLTRVRISFALPDDRG